MIKEKKYRYVDAAELTAMGGAVADERGIPCRACGCRHHKTLETAHTSKGQIRRRRECRHCKLRFTTYEEAA